MAYRAGSNLARKTQNMNKQVSEGVFALVLCRRGGAPTPSISTCTSIAEHMLLWRAAGVANNLLDDCAPDCSPLGGPPERNYKQQTQNNDNYSVLLSLEQLSRGALNWDVLARCSLKWDRDRPVSVVSIGPIGAKSHALGAALPGPAPQRAPHLRNEPLRVRSEARVSLLGPSPQARRGGPRCTRPEPPRQRSLVIPGKSSERVPQTQKHMPRNQALDLDEKTCPAGMA